MTTLYPEASKNTATAFPIVGIGASAGGLEAFEQFFHHAPVNSGMGFVLVPHLDPCHASLLSDILQRATTMPVIEALDQIPVEPNHVYIIPPNRDMEIFHGELQLSVPTIAYGLRLPIDSFLRSLAEDQQENAVGIILSGTGSDGTQGARAIIGVGGIVLVQEPITAKYDGMPNSVIQAGYVTRILPVNKMGEALESCIHCVVLRTDTPVSPQKVSGIKRVLIQLRSITGHDFSLYKQSTISRRIERRMLQHNIDNIDIYARYLKENPAEARILFKDLLINVTNFFRDAEAFAILKHDILPALCKYTTHDSVFRVWVPGCSTGEEAYSIAILLCEYMVETHQEFRVQIYATDLDDEVVAIARVGLYRLNIAQDVTPERLRRFFIKEETGYRIKKEIREMVIFAIQNAIKDPPFTKLDLLSCRNLMIYLGSELQNRLIATFHYALKPDGILFLSPSESIGNHTELFSAVSRKWKFYRATHSLASTQLLMTRPSMLAEQDHSKVLEKITQASKKINIDDWASRMLAQFFAPASVIIDSTGNILYVHGDTGKYLRPALGKASLNIIEMAREGLSLSLRTAIHAAGNDGIHTLNQELQVKTNGEFTAVSLSVRPLPDSNSIHNQLLVSFQDIASPKKPIRRRGVAKTVESARIEELERHLLYAKQSCQISIGEQQANNEELKSVNEELQSTNEELQSSNEELETSKEELQSVNEELISVNSELQTKIEQLAYMQNDIKNLLDNICMGIIFLDRHLIIRRFTHEATRLYRLIATDVGRPLNDIKGLAEVNNLLSVAQEVLDSLVPYEREIHLSDDTWMLVRIQVYRTLDNMIDGVVLIFTDISARIKAIATQEALSVAEGIVSTVRGPFLVLDSKLSIIFASDSFYSQFQLKPEDTVGQQIYQLGDHQWDNPALRDTLTTVLSVHSPIEDVELEHNFPIIGHHKLLLNARRIVGKTGILPMILLSIEKTL
jgi:two-component system CheB/CheR fusion protein